jgi:hypothetical protein
MVNKREVAAAESFADDSGVVCECTDPDRATSAGATSTNATVRNFPPLKSISNLIPEFSYLV